VVATVAAGGVPGRLGGRGTRAVAVVGAAAWSSADRPAALDAREAVADPAVDLDPVRKPSTGCGSLRQSHNANAEITGREAHKNDGSNASATMIYSNTHDDPKAYSHIPSETRRRTCTIPTAQHP